MDCHAWSGDIGGVGNRASELESRGACNVGCGSARSGAGTLRCRWGGFVAREEQRGPLQRSARARSRREKERPREHCACAARGWGTSGAVCESQRARVQRDVDFVSHWCSRGERMESQVRCVVGIVFIDSISRLSVFFPSFVFGLLLVRGWGRGRVCVL